MYDNDFQAHLIVLLERIARSQEGMLAIAAEAREERLKLAEKMKQHFKTGFTPERIEEK